MRKKLSTKTQEYLRKHTRPDTPPPKPSPAASETIDSRQLETIFGRRTQAAIYEDLKLRHRGDIPAKVIWNHIADRREFVIAMTYGAELARS